MLDSVKNSRGDKRHSLQVYMSNYRKSQVESWPFMTLSNTATAYVASFPIYFKDPSLFSYCLISCLCRPWRHLRYAVCRGRHRVENRVGEVQARDGGGRGGAGRHGYVLR